MHIRPAAVSDADRVFELLTQFAVSYQPNRSAFNRSFALLLQDEDADLQVAYIDGEVVGYILAFRLLTLFANGRIMEIQELMVDPAHRGKGVGKALVWKAVELAWEAGCPEVTVPSRRAGGYYTRLGFVETAHYYKLRRNP